VKESFIEVDYGDLDGTSLAAITTDHWRVFEYEHEHAFGGGESLADVDARVHAELERLLGDESSLLYSPTRHLAIVSHVSPIKSAAIWALGAPGSTAWRMRLENGSLTMIGVRARLPQLIRFNAVPLL
ncbi:MAG: histidine phosphatase family protein, partial [Acidimicrobiales bacterium]